MFDLSGKKALVTGSTQGIGMAIAQCLSDFGATVFINGTDEGKAKGVAQKIPGSIAAAYDLSLKDCAEMLYEKTGDIDILILNASIQYRAAWNEITDYEFDEQITVNVKSSMKLIQKYAPYMMTKKWGRIVTIGSVQQVKPHKDMLVYAASKAAQLNMVLNLAKQLAPFGITVNNIAPGVIETPRNADALSNKEYERQILRNIPCGFSGVPADCVGQVLLVCSDEGKYINGEDIFVDGGMKL